MYISNYATSFVYCYEVYSTLYSLCLGHNHKGYTRTLSQINHSTKSLKKDIVDNIP